MAGTYIEIGGGSGGSVPPALQPIQLSVPNAGALPLAGDNDGQLIYVRDTESIYAWDAVGLSWDHILNGLADVSGPSGATDEAVGVFDGVTGKLIKETPVLIDPSGNVTGVADLTATGKAQANAVEATSYVQFPALTTVQRNALTAANGMVVYNTDINLFQGYASGAWVNLHGWGA